MRSASLEDGVKKRGEEKSPHGKAAPGWPYTTHWTDQAGEGSFRDREGEEGGCKPTCLPFRISEQASAGGHGHILLPSPQPLMRDVGGAESQAAGWGREGSWAETRAARRAAEPGEG